jgi:putative endonuclease
MFQVYILYSEQLDRYYIGQTENLGERLRSHRSGISRFTSIAKDWIVVYTEDFVTREEAIKREYKIKRMKSRKYIEMLIQSKR